jgi:undecaprenyl pyrophosphate synthase
VVVAHKGRIAPRHLIGKSHGGNIVDGPALEWLSHQPRPRVWVSDTQVTGVHDMGSTELRKVCLDWCVKHQIKVVTAFDPITVARSLHSSHRKLVARERKRNPYEG